MSKYKLCIDPGHGYGNRSQSVYDPGACAGGASEADIVLSWALTIRWLFRGAGIEVFLTRDDDRDYTPVGSRDNRANDAGCTHFLSLHCNAASNPLISGIETFHRHDLAWAERVHAAGVQATGHRSRGIKTESMSQHSRLAVLDFGGQAALLELGFITHPGDRRRMLARETRLRFAENLLAAWKGLR